MRIQHNIMAMNVYRNYNKNTSALSKNLEKLSSGYKINRAGDDAAGLAISEKMRAQITGLEAAQKNVKDGISLVNTSEGAMQEIQDMLNRMVYLATQSANGTYDNEVDRKNLQQEVDQLRSEINRIADSANFNGIKLMDGVSGSGSLTKLPVDYNTVSTTAGVTLDSVKDGAGTKGVYTIDIKNKFSYGDQLNIKGYTEGTTEIGAGGGAGLTLTMGTNFTGDTAEDQAQSIKDTLTGSIGGYFDVKAEGTQIIITAKQEGTLKPETDPPVKVGSIDSVTITNQDMAITADTGTAAANGTANAKQYIGSFEVIGGKTSANAANIEVGDTLTFKFKDANGKELTAKITANAEMTNPSAATATEAIVKALQEAHFDDNKDTTGVDESQLKVGDLFTLTANKEETVAAGVTANGTIRVEGANAVVPGGSSAVDFTITKKNGSEQTFAATEGQASLAATTLATQSWESTAITTTNFTAGDKVKITGTLKDGRDFEILLEAGKDFEVDKNTTIATAAKNTLDNLAEALKSKDVNVVLKDGTTKEVIEGAKMTGEDLFGDKGEFTASATAGGVFKIVAKNAGKPDINAASNINTVEVKPLASAEAPLTRELPDAQGAAKSSFTFDDKLSYGAAVTVGDNTYEIVADARDTVNRNNTAVVVKDQRHRLYC